VKDTSDDLLNSEINAAKLSAWISYSLAALFVALGGVALAIGGSANGFLCVALLGIPLFAILGFSLSKKVGQCKALAGTVTVTEPSEETIEMHGEKRKAIIWVLQNAMEPLKFDKEKDIVLLRRGLKPLVFIGAKRKLGRNQKSIWSMPSFRL
jgi:hypothetical protein